MYWPVCFFEELLGLFVSEFWFLVEANSLFWFLIKATGAGAWSLPEQSESEEEDGLVVLSIS